MFYAVVARDRVEGVVTACTHLGRRRFYVFAVFGDPSAPTTWVDGVVYALPPAGFRREWGNEWVSPDSVRPQLRVRVRPTDFPLLDTVVGLTSPIGLSADGSASCAPRSVRRAATP